jgi:hypothetical protein
MIEQYLIGSIAQSQERVRQLSQIVQDQYPREYDGLRQICRTQLESVRAALQRLAAEAVVDTSLQTPRRVREFKRAVEQLSAIESIGVFALRRTDSGDDFLNRLITDICREIQYPLIPPTISQMSQEYFHIYTEFNLLCMPLIESRFLLHLADIYHELCHPFHRSQHADLPRLEPYHTAYKQSLFTTVEHFAQEAVVAERLRQPQGKLFQLQLWRNCWVKYWTEELFCDLFGVLTAGPAYAWSHYHLCVKRGGDPFETPLMLSSTHPADDARMRAILKMLSAMGEFETETARIGTAWSDFVSTMGFKPMPEYSHCYADAILSEIVKSAKQGSEAVRIRVAAPEGMSPVVALLNEAWATFWSDPDSYTAWEADALARLREGKTLT